MIVQKWKQCGVAVQGKDHISAGVVCQDNVATAAKHGVHAIALSDGGGSRKFSQIGSEFSTRAVCGLLVERFDEFYATMDLIDAGDPKAQKDVSGRGFHPQQRTTSSLAAFLRRRRHAVRGRRGTYPGMHGRAGSSYRDTRGHDGISGHDDT